MPRHPIDFVLPLLGIAAVAVLAYGALPVDMSPTLPVPVVVVAVLVGIGSARISTTRWRRREREHTLRQARAMLRERLSGPLHVLLRAAVPPGDPPGSEERARIAEIVNAVRSVESTLELISDDTLRAWQVTAQRTP